MEKETQKKDGLTYWIEKVNSGHQCIGQSATRVAENLEEACEVYGTQTIFEKAMSQIRTDNRNAVRASASGGKLKASEVISLFIDGTLNPTDVQENAQKWNVDTTTAAERMIHEEPDADRITWPVIVKKDEKLPE